MTIDRLDISNLPFDQSFPTSNDFTVLTRSLSNLCPTQDGTVVSDFLSSAQYNKHIMQMILPTNKSLNGVPVTFVRALLDANGTGDAYAVLFTCSSKTGCGCKNLGAGDLSKAPALFIDKKQDTYLVAFSLQPNYNYNASDGGRIIEADLDVKANVELNDLKKQGRN